ncbi:MAG: ATP synthase F1 subunit delta [Candidatus Magnetominusculus sp. LBB02]|nr:ATP synthase F1 subunit delta [Candidatus Magnetominusculus sp. LBB02]
MKISGKLAIRFARSIFASVAVDKLDVVIKELTVISRLMCGKKHLTALFMNPFFNSEDRMKAMDIIADSLALDNMTVKILAKLVESRQINGLAQILTILAVMQRESMKTANAVVTSPVPLTEEQTLALKNALGSRLKKSITIETAIDTSLIGGLVAKVGNLIIDSSIKGQLRLLTEALTKE